LGTDRPSPKSYRDTHVEAVTNRDPFTAAGNSYGDRSRPYADFPSHRSSYVDA